MKIYVIEQGEYSDYHVVGVFSTRENAERILTIINGSENHYYKAEIAEWELDPTIKELNAGLNPYRVVMDYFGKTERCEEIEHPMYDDQLRVWGRTKAAFWEHEINVSDAVAGTVWAADEKHAIKIANEYRAQQIALNKMSYRGNPECMNQNQPA